MTPSLRFIFTSHIHMDLTQHPGFTQAQCNYASFRWKSLGGIHLRLQSWGRSFWAHVSFLQTSCSRQCLIGVYGKSPATRIIVISIMRTLSTHTDFDSSLWTLYFLASGFNLRRLLLWGRGVWLLLFYWAEVSVSLLGWQSPLSHLLDVWPQKISKPSWALCFLICMIRIIRKATLRSWCLSQFGCYMWKLFITYKEMHRCNVNIIKSTVVVDARCLMKTLSASKRQIFPLEKIIHEPNKM